MHELPKATSAREDVNMKANSHMRIVPTPGQAISLLAKLAPCPIIHSTEELPQYDIEYGIRHGSSCYYPRFEDKYYWRSQDYIYINHKRRSRSWRYVFELTHEVGHALDYNGLHPAQELLGLPMLIRRDKDYSGLYRNELAAAAFEILFGRCMGRLSSKKWHEWSSNSCQWLYWYGRPSGMPDLEDVLDAMEESGQLMCLPLMADLDV